LKKRRPRRGSDFKPLEGVASATRLLAAIMNLGLFQSLEFSQNVVKKRASKQRVTLTPAEVQATLAGYHITEAGSYSKVHFNTVIEVDQLVIPTCPEHGIFFMRFAKEGDAKELDFRALKDQSHSGMMLDSKARCLGCNRDLGAVARLKMPERTPSKEKERLKAAKSVGFLGALSKLFPLVGSTIEPEFPGLVGILKWTDPGPIRGVSGCSARSGGGSKDFCVAPSPKAEARLTKPIDTGLGKANNRKAPPVAQSSFFGFGACCTMCSNNQEQIATTTTIVQPHRAVSSASSAADLATASSVSSVTLSQRNPRLAANSLSGA
jgi:hypothetical protein